MGISINDQGAADWQLALPEANWFARDYEWAFVLVPSRVNFARRHRERRLTVLSSKGIERIRMND